MVTFRWCAGCAADTEFERFDCADHGVDCLELVCLRCGLGWELGGGVGVELRRDLRPGDRQLA